MVNLKIAIHDGAPLRYSTHHHFFKLYNPPRLYKTNLNLLEFFDFVDQDCLICSMDLQSVSTK